MLEFCSFLSSTLALGQSLPAEFREHGKDGTTKHSKYNTINSYLPLFLIMANHTAIHSGPYPRNLRIIFNSSVLIILTVKAVIYIS